MRSTFSNFLSHNFLSHRSAPGQPLVLQSRPASWVFDWVVVLSTIVGIRSGTIKITLDVSERFTGVFGDAASLASLDTPGRPEIVSRNLAAATCEPAVPCSVNTALCPSPTCPLGAHSLCFSETFRKSECFRDSEGREMHKSPVLLRPLNCFCQEFTRPVDFSTCPTHGRLRLWHPDASTLLLKRCCGVSRSLIRAFEYRHTVGFPRAFIFGNTRHRKNHTSIQSCSSFGYHLEVFIL